MRILFVANTPRDPTLGAAGCDIATIEALRALGHDVDEIWAADMPRRIAHGNLHQLVELPRNYVKIVDKQCSNKVYDVVQINQPHAYLAARRHQQVGRSAVFINRSHGWEPALREAVARYGGFHTDTRPCWRKATSRLMAHFLEKHNQRVVRWSDGIVLCSLDDRQYLIDRHKADPERLLALTPGLAPEFLASIPSNSPGRWRRLLYIGNFCPPKAPRLVADVFRRVIASVPSSTATWVCPSEFHAEARRLLGDTGAGAVTLMDSMTRTRIRGLLDQHGLLVFPSYFEGFGMVFLEAMSRGLCVLGTSVGGMKQVIHDGVDGFLFSPGSADAITERAVQLLSNPDDCDRISREARRTALTFTWEHTAQEYATFCQKLIKMKLCHSQRKKILGFEQESSCSLCR